MPEIDLITPVYHNPMDPYHHEFDNLPLRKIIDRQVLINFQVDINADILRDSNGTAGTLANRLNRSLDGLGDLKASAIDAASHNIAEHTDGSVLISGTPVGFVRMLEDERDKLGLISDEATALQIQVETISTTVLFDDETIELLPSDTVSWSVTAPNKLKANLAFSASAAHQHHYDKTPVHANLATPDYTNYKTTSVSTAYVEDSLRIYINGIKLSETASVYVPGPTGPDGTWTLTTYTANHSAGTFQLSRAIAPTDIIRIDFDVALT